MYCQAQSLGKDVVNILPFRGGLQIWSIRFSLVILLGSLWSELVYSPNLYQQTVRITRGFVQSIITLPCVQ